MANNTEVWVWTTDADGKASELIGRGVLVDERLVVIYTPIEDLPAQDSPVLAAVRRDGEFAEVGGVAYIDPDHKLVGALLDTEQAGPYDEVTEDDLGREPPHDVAAAFVIEYVKRWRQGSDPTPLAPQPPTDVEGGTSGPYTPISVIKIIACVVLRHC